MLRTRVRRPVQHKRIHGQTERPQQRQHGTPRRQIHETGRRARRRAEHDAEEHGVHNRGIAQPDHGSADSRGRAAGRGDPLRPDQPQRVGTIRELSTIKVLGFHTSETTMYIYRETILLSLLGILAGYGFGEWLHRYIITEVPPDEVMFDPAISWIALAAPAIVVAVVLAVLGWIVYRQLETVDMLEALKSVE